MIVSAERLETIIGCPWRWRGTPDTERAIPGPWPHPVLHHVAPEAALFVMSLVKAASRALLSAEGYQVERALAILDQWLEDASERAAP